MTTRTLRGIAVSPSLAIGPVQVVRAGPDRIPVWSVPEKDIPHELARLARALGAANDELERRQAVVANETSAKDAEIFAVHRMILQDPGALSQVERAIREERVNAEMAVQALIERFEQTLGKLEGDSVRGYASDMSDPWRVVQSALLNLNRAEVLSSERQVVLAAAELTPQVVTFLERNRILAIITEAGGRFSHGAVLARAFGIPCVVGLPNLLSRLEQGMLVAVDGDNGTTQLRPDQEAIDAFLEERDRLLARQEALREQASLSATTPDGRELKVMINIESLRDLDDYDIAQVDGIGLCRTEFLYMERSQFPSEEEQYRLYRRLLERMEGKPVVMRTLDIGGDKQLPYFGMPEEKNPALGWRGLRLTLRWKDLLSVQFRALLRASVHGDLRILLPMVTSVEEVSEARELFDGVRQSLTDQGYEVEPNIPVGIMVEVPSALLALSTFLDAVDFVSVGTNDLVQYLLAVDRDNSWVADLYDPHHPAVALALKQVVDATADSGTPCSVCGDIAGDPAMSLLLMGMGYDSVSVGQHFVPEIKYAIRATRSDTAAAYVRDVLSQRSSKGVRETLARVRDELYGEGIDAIP